jgi:hypothetical protein
MKEKELNEILKRASVPEREAGYWEQFPGRVTAGIERRRREGEARRGAGSPAHALAGWAAGGAWTAMFRFLGSKPGLAVGVAAACVAGGFFLGFRSGRGSPGHDLQLAQVQKYYREIEALFPNQLEAIVFDQKGTHLVLAKEANVPASTPLYVKVCGPEGCERFVTFSGQQIRFNGEVCDVLTDREGHVLLVGRQLVWSSGQALAKAGRYRIEAQPLQAIL